MQSLPDLLATTYPRTSEFNRQLGFYTVNGEIFSSKLLALVAATKSNSMPDWHFNREVFDSFQWHVEPEFDLRQLYRKRAQQIREQYDYVRLEFSGGGDSATVLYSFVNNNIFLDEVVLRYPQQGSWKATDDPLDHTASNALSELKYAAGPILKWLETASPRTKITVHDYSLETVNTDTDESWIYNTQEYFEPSWIYKHRVDATVDHKRQLDLGKSVCVLWGIDKPKLCIRDHKWFLYFLDIQTNIVTEHNKLYTNVNHEYFYWSPALPELLSKQAHIVKNWFNLPSNKYLQHLVRWPNNSFSQRTTYEHIIKPLIYEDYDPTTFQVSKPTSSFYNEMDHWFYRNCADTDRFKTWQAGLAYITNNVDQKWFNRQAGRPSGFVGFLSAFYYIGEAHYESSGANQFEHVWN